jgi:hypothetical protein
VSRLTNSERDQIVSNALKGPTTAYGKRTEALEQREVTLAERAYDHIFSKVERAWAVSAPKRDKHGTGAGPWLRTDKCLRFNVGGYHVQFNHPTGFPVPSANSYCHQLGVIASDTDLGQEIIKHIQKKERAREELDNTSRELRALLGSITTTKQLVEAWPEGAEFYTGVIATEGKPTTALVVKFTDINAKLGVKEKTDV